MAGPILGKVIVSPEISRRFSHLHFDLVGPLQYSNSFKYIFTIIDCMSKWMEAIPVSEIFATSCAKLLLGFLILECPKRSLLIVGCNLVPTFGFNFAKCLTFRTSEHPELNDAVERLHRHLKDALCACAAVATWSEELPFVLLGLRSQPGKTLVFPRLRQFLVHKLSCQMNFCKILNFQ